MRLAPKDAEAFEGYAKLWSGAGHGVMAVETAKRTCVLSDWLDWLSLRTYAAASE